MKEDEKEEKSKYQACHICHGMGGIESSSGDTRDCPNRKCVNGMIKIEKEITNE